MAKRAGGDAAGDVWGGAHRTGAPGDEAMFGSDAFPGFCIARGRVCGGRVVDGTRDAALLAGGHLRPMTPRLLFCTRPQSTAKALSLGFGADAGIEVVEADVTKGVE